MYLQQDSDIEKVAFKTAVCIRPLSAKQLTTANENNDLICVKSSYVQNKSYVTLLHAEQGTQKVFSFDNVFDCQKSIICNQESKQDENQLNSAPQISFYQKMNHTIVKQIIQSVFQGYSSSCIVYGQTGSGKKHTLFGKNYNYTFKQHDSQVEGLLFRFSRQLFDKLHQVKQFQQKQISNEYQITMSMIEIYNQKIVDLLASKNQFDKFNKFEPLKIRQNKLKGIYVQNLSKNSIQSFQDIVNYLILGNKTSLIKATHMSCLSSRTHIIVTFEMKEKINRTDDTQIRDHKSDGVNCESKQILNSKQIQLSRTIKIDFVKLAGSQKVTKTISSRSAYTQNTINRSLSCLGLVIWQLAKISEQQIKKIKQQHTENKQASALQYNDHVQQNKHPKIFIPYRDSVLTRYLQDCLGKKSKTWIIGTISPCSTNYQESLNTLKFIAMAKKANNKAKKQVFQNVKPIQSVSYMQKQQQTNSKQCQYSLHVQYSKKSQFQDKQEPLIQKKQSQ